MTVIQLFGHDTSIVSEANFELVFGGLHEGVVAGVNDECRVNATAPVTAQVRVEIGTFVTGGVFARVSVADLLTIPANVSGQDRIDRIICKRDNAADLSTVEVLQGTPAGAPVPPALTRAGDDYEISLAQVYVANGFVTIAAEDIRSERDDPDVCGFASGKASEHRLQDIAYGVGFPFGGWEAYQTTLVHDIGGWNASTVDDASAYALGADGLYLEQDTDGLLNDEARVHVTGDTVTRRDRRPVLEIKFELVDLTDIRFFAGYQSAFASILASDAPAIDYAGVQFSTARPDTNFQLVVGDTVAQTIFDTGIAVDADVHFVRVSCDIAESEILIELFDANHDIEASAVFDSDLPGLTDTLGVLCGIRALAVAVKQIRQYRARGSDRKP